MPQLFLALLFLGFSGFAHAEDADIARLFDEAGVDGTLVIESAGTGQRYVHNEARAKQPFTAASTFKVLNTLIALEEGAIAGADEIIPWDNTRYEIEDWNRDQTLKSAFQVSCVWCYQWLARRVGAADYPPHIRQAHYGQLREPFNGTEFWLDGSLTITTDRAAQTRDRAQPAVPQQQLRHIEDGDAHRSHQGLSPLRQDRLGRPQHARHRLVHRLRGDW